jgi:cytidyltransferase-like protein
VKVVAVSGYFDPLHVGHLEYFELAAQLGDKLVVIVNNDEQANLKKGRPFMKENDRVAIIKALRCVDEAFLSIDKERSVCESIKAVRPDIFANGGDRTIGEVPETKVCRELGIEIVDNLGKKIRSSSGLTGIV